jgi:hypothetical protein
MTDRKGNESIRTSFGSVGVPLFYWLFMAFWIVGWSWGAWQLAHDEARSDTWRVLTWAGITIGWLFAFWALFLLPPLTFVRVAASGVVVWWIRPWSFVVERVPLADVRDPTVAEGLDAEGSQRFCSRLGLPSGRTADLGSGTRREVVEATTREFMASVEATRRAALTRSLRPG